jgi:putative transposase
VEISAVICSTNAIESPNARYRRSVKARGKFPTEQASMKRLDHALEALNAIAITFADRWPTAETY